MKKLVIRRPDDFHNHFREGEVLQNLIPYTTRIFARAVVMPNLTLPILTAKEAVQYRDQILKACKKNSSDFEPLMTIQGTEKTTTKMLEEARKAGIRLIKYFPKIVNERYGIGDYGKIFPQLEVAQDLDMVALFHGEIGHSWDDCLKWEHNFHGQYISICKEFPRLKTVLEHITTHTSILVVNSIENAAATITPHHLILTFSDVVGNRMKPHNFCMPIAKNASDRYELICVAVSADPKKPPKFFLGTDNAPHPLIGSKECKKVKPGIFNAPVALPLLAKIFEEFHSLENLEYFVSEAGARFYNLPLNKGTITLAKEPWTVPLECFGVVPFLAGGVLEWQVASDES